MQEPPTGALRALHCLLPLVLCGSLAAQGVAYTIENLGAVPGAYSTNGTGLNDNGTVVGWSQVFGGPAGIVGWVWTPESGFEVLPQPFGMSSSRAIDINEAGVIAGDGGYDSGVSWRYDNGRYELLDTVGGDPRAYTSGINAQGNVLGTSLGFSFTVPQKVFLNVQGLGSLELLGDGYSGYLNDLDQVAGTATPGVVTIEAFRYTPGVGVELLGPLGGKTFTRGTSINNLGHVVGYATSSNGNGAVPFLYTDQAGMVEIGSFGGGASASGINDRGEVVGTFSTSGGGRPWIWTQEEGVRFLGDLVDPSSPIRLLSASRINARGQILVQGFDNSVADFRSVLLTPIERNPSGPKQRLGGALPR